MSIGRMMRRIAAVALATLAIGGCSDTQESADQKAIQEIDAAGRLVSKATGMMSGAVYKVDGEYAPLTRAGRPRGEVTEVQPAWTPHPQAWQDLETAENKLSEALRTYGQASEGIQASAYSAMGQVLLAKGWYQDLSANAARQEASEAIGQAEKACLASGAWAAMLERVQGTSDVEAQAREMLSSARAEIEGLNAQIAETSQSIASIRQQVQSLQARNEEIIPQARNLRVDIQLAGGDKGLELTEQVLAIEKEINANASGIAKLEGDLELREARRQESQEAKKRAEARVAAATSILEGGQASAVRQAQDQAAVRAAMEKARNDARQATDRVIAACAVAAQAENLAADAFDLAAKKSQHAAGLGAGTARAAAQSEEADALWSLANLQARRLRLRRQCVRLTECLAEAWAESPAVAVKADDSPTATRPARQIAKPSLPPPEFAKPLLEYMTEAEETWKSAAGNYQRAAELYGEAAESVPPQARWVYQGHQAAAYLALHQLTNQTDALALARTILEEALKDKRESPYLASLVDLEKLAKTRR